MSASLANESRVVTSVHGVRQVNPDPGYEIGLSQMLAQSYSPAELLEQYVRFAGSEGEFDAVMRRAIWQAVAKRFGSGVRIGSDIGFRHLKTFEIGDGVFIGACPGLTVGKGTNHHRCGCSGKERAPGAIFAGVPAHFVRWRDGFTSSLENE